MKSSSLYKDEETNYEYTGEYFEYERENSVEVLAYMKTITDELIERTIPETERVLTLEKAANCLSVLGKIWNLAEYSEIYEKNSGKCLKAKNERLLDMEGYVEEYQYLHLEAVDMALSDISVIPHFIWLLSVDVSGNRLTNISAGPLTKLQNLVCLKLNRNRIDDPWMEPMKHLQYLGMNSNIIKFLHRICHPNLLNLDLKWNQIGEIQAENCRKLKKLKMLELRGNRLTTTAGIRYANLEELYLAENQIAHLGGMEYLPKLKRLHLRQNPLSTLSGFTKDNSNLEYLNVRSCKIEQMNELEKLKILKGLKVLVVTDNLFNPADSEGNELEHENIRNEILMMHPHLTRINKKIVTVEERKALEDLTTEI